MRGRERGRGGGRRGEGERHRESLSSLSTLPEGAEGGRAVLIVSAGKDAESLEFSAGQACKMVRPLWRTG